MGRSAAPPPLDLDIVRQTIAVRQDGALIRRQSRMSAFSGEPAVFQNMVCIRHDGVTRRLAAPRVAYAIQTEAWPPRGGQVRLKSGDSDYRLDNLEAVKACSHRPHAKGGRATSLVTRQAADRALLEAMLSHLGAAVEQLGRLTGRSEARTCTHLGKLANLALVESPQCCPGRAWALTAKRKAAAIGVSPLLDDLDRDILAVLRSAAMGPVRLGRRVGCCELTVRRRAKALAAKGLVIVDPRKFYAVTPSGLAAIGEAAPARWVDTARISAAAARDVQNRIVSPTGDMSQAERSRISSLSAQKARANARAGKNLPFNDTFREFDRLKTG